MRWFLIAQDMNGARTDMGEFGSEAEAIEAKAAYEHAHPEHHTYHLESRLPIGAVPSSDRPTFVAAPRTNIETPAAAATTAAATQPDDGSSRVKLWVGAWAAVLALAVGGFALFYSSGSSDVADDGSPEPTPRAQVDEAEPTVVPVPTAVAIEPIPEPTPISQPPEPQPPEPQPQPTAIVQAPLNPQNLTTIAEIQSRGVLRCGVSGRAFPFSTVVADESVVGFDADMCRAVAAALLGDSEAVDLIPLSAAERFTALQVGDVDLLMRNSTQTFGRDVDINVDFGPTTYFDGQQLMGRVSDGFSSDTSLAETEGSTICTIAGTTTEQNMVREAAELGIALDLNTFEDFGIVIDTFIAGGCDLITTDGSVLLARMAENEPADQDWIIFPRVPISKEPFGPIYRSNDSEFADAVNWTIYAMLIADENQITINNAGDAIADTVPVTVSRFFSGEGGIQSILGLSPDAYFQVISQVGSYSDVYNRHIEPAGLALDGSLNDLWSNGGLMYPPPGR